MIVLNYASLLTSQNVQAFYRVVREGESSQSDDAYRMRYGGWDPDRKRHLPPKFFDDFSAHPRVMELTPTGERSSAAGAPQITWTTWSTVCMAKYGLGPDFKPYTQDCAYVALLHNRGALEDVVDGRFDEALRKCRGEWASLPNSTLQDGGSKLTYQRARAVYSAWGGSFAEDVYVIKPETQTQEPAPIEERFPEITPQITEEGNMAAPFALIVPLVQGLIELFAPVARAKIAKTLDKTTGDPAISKEFADKLLALAQQAAAQALPGVVPPPTAEDTPALAAPAVVPENLDPVVAVGVVKSNPALVAQVEQEFMGWLDQMAPVFDRIERLQQQEWEASESSMDRAAARASVAQNDDWMAKALVYGILGVSGLLILFVGGVAIAQISLLQTRTPTTEIWAAITGIIGTCLGVLGTVYAYRFGTSRSSSAKDVVIAEMTNERRIRNG